MSFLEIYALAVPFIILAMGLGVAWWAVRDDPAKKPKL